jgi:hypothetical protein
MVPSTGALTDVSSAEPAKLLRCQNLALDGDLMFDQSDVPPRMAEILW